MTQVVTPPRDYVENDVPPEEDHDEPHKPMPLWHAVVAFGVCIGIGLMIIEGTRAVMAIIRFLT